MTYTITETLFFFVFFFPAGKSLQELRKLYLKLKDAVFGKQTLGVSYNTDALERLLKEAFGMEIRMSDVKYPK